MYICTRNYCTELVLLVGPTSTQHLSMVVGRLLSCAVTSKVNANVARSSKNRYMPDHVLPLILIHYQSKGMQNITLRLVP